MVTALILFVIFIAVVAWAGRAILARRAYRAMRKDFGKDWD